VLTKFLHKGRAMAARTHMGTWNERNSRVLMSLL
jgi:hypothetical protein